MKALIKVNDFCNQTCAFCHRGGPGRADVPATRVDALIDRAAALGHRMVVLSGGEPTLRPELLAWADRTYALGLEIGLVTNGTPDPALVGGLLGRGLRYVQLSLHGGTSEVHDDLVRARSFHRALRALAALDGNGLDLWVNCVVTRRNLPHLREVATAVAPFADAGLKFSFVEVRGSASGGFEAVVPRVTDAAEAVADALNHARSLLGPARRLAHDGLPLCLLPGLEHLRGDLRAHRFGTMAELGEEDLHPVDGRNAFHPDHCRPCALRGECPGLYVGYHARLGAEEVRPLTGRLRPASFVFEYEGRLDTRGSRCPLEEIGVAPWDAGRHLFVRNGERVGRFRTSTRDFSDEEILRVKRRAGQVYFEIPGGDASIARPSLVKLRSAASCHACTLAPSCAGLYEPSLNDADAPAESRLLGLLGTTGGNVLEVGCSDEPHSAVLADAASEGRLRHFVLAPDLSRAEGRRVRSPLTIAVAGSPECLPFMERQFDHIFLLRTWNRLRDPTLAIANLLASLRFGGSLTITDDEPFALASTRPGWVRPTFERLRNDGAAEAADMLRSVAPGMRLVERLDVDPSGSTRWLIRYVVADG